MKTGKDPMDEIDHIDLCRNNNNIDNLREANRSQNGSNRKKQSNNTSGFTGVAKNGKNWRALVKSQNQIFHLGTFATREEANEVYCRMASKLHGKYRRES
jgi:hypothetical protein